MTQELYFLFLRKREQKEVRIKSVMLSLNVPPYLFPPTQT